MVSVFPPNYGLVSLFNVSYNTILDIVEHGHSDAFFNKCENLLMIKTKAFILLKEYFKTFLKLILRLRKNYKKYYLIIRYLKIIKILGLDQKVKR